ncbi:DUF3849 domain-containing protein [Porcincola intestinalis]|uniref:DUF3849 domain-containing protein n=1 Tax=Porcincola intestinalis TaxID=2606632 RepID=A0A6L5X366_9FIRM|nr:DUF3849 domain-containing protein [Porcincola intestinalis]MSS13813.1 DUF3849 domain-containing protein [Porcincola intestinalis]
MATNREERMKEVTDRLQAGLEELFNSEKYAEYLRVMSQFHHYSFNNTLLIAMQRPDATLVAGYHAWDKKFNRHVMRGEKGIQIIAPAPIREKQEQEKVDPNTGEAVLGENGQPETEEVTITIPRFKVSTVFDLSQTDGDPLPDLGVEELTASVENYEIFMEAIRNVAPVPVRFDEIASGAKGYYSSTDKEIVIRSGMSEMQTMKTAVHETAHAILHDKDIMQEQGIQKDQQTREVEAESVAFATLAHFELDTSEYSFPYIAGWSSGRDTKELKSSLDTIRRTASEIIDGIEAGMREQLLERQEQNAELLQESDIPGREELLSTDFQEITLYDVPMLYSNGRVDRAALPEGISCYDLRGSDYDPGSPIRLEEQVMVNHAATVISAFPIDVSELKSLRLGEELNFEDGEVTLAEYIESMKELDQTVQEEHLENAIGRANENLYLDGAENRFAIYQLKEDEEYRNLQFMNTEYLANHDLAVEGENYNYVYGDRLPDGETLDGIYERFNLRHPEGYSGHSLSVSDIVVMQCDGEARAYYVDSFGFSEMDEFVEQRQRITARQHRIEDAYINRESLGIIVDGHEGTWRAIEGKEIGGEMFYLMESQEYGKEAANILLHMDGDLVAEDLWNGIDYGVMQAVREYFDDHGIEYSPLDFPLQERYSIGTEVAPSGKVLFYVMDNVTRGPQGDHGEVKLYDDRTELLEQVRSMNGIVQSVYRESAAYARDHAQIEAYRTSRQENHACKEGIEQVIRENFDGMHLNRGVIKPVIDRFGAERTAYVLANTVQYATWDGRYSRSNKEWAASVMTGVTDEDRRTDFLVTSHPAVLDGFVDMFRKELTALGLEQDGTKQVQEDAIEESMESDVLPEEMKLAAEIDQFVYDYDHYEYMDLYDSREKTLAQLQDNFREKQVSGIKDWLKEVIEKSNDPKSASMARDFLTRMEEMFPEKEASLTYYVAECMEFPVLGEYHEVDTLAEAVKLYGQIPAERMNGTESIGFHLDDGSDHAGTYPLMEGGKVVTEMIDLVGHFKNSPLVQKAVEDIRQYYPDMRETEYQPRETEETAPAVTQTSAGIIPVERAEGTVNLLEKATDVPEKHGNEVTGGRRESVLKALRERKAQIKEREKNVPVQKDNDRKKGEPSL